MIQSSFSSLRKRAELLLRQGEIESDALNNKDLYKLVEELTLHQIDLELQKNNLIKIQSELEEARNKYAELYQLAPAGYLILDGEGSIIEVNQAGASLFGMKEAALINQRCAQFFAPEFQEGFANFCQNVLESDAMQTCELKLSKKNEPFCFVQLEARVMVRSGKPTKRLFLVLTDISKRKQNDEVLHRRHLKIAQVDRLSSMKELTSAAAHELNQPLGVISNYIHGCIRRLQNGNFQPDNMLYAMKQAALQLSRAADIIQHMRNIANRVVLNHENICIDSIIKETIEFLNYEILDFPVCIQYRPIAETPQIMFDRVHFQHVLLHLLRNAIEAMRDVNTVQPLVIIEVNQCGVEWIEVRVVDNGPGFDEETMQQLFEPEFTAKQSGVGLGLAVTRKLIESYGGELSVGLNPDCGACFKFMLPVRLVSNVREPQRGCVA